MKNRVLNNEAELLAWGADASCYRIIPQAVVFPETEEEVSAALQQAAAKGHSVTFRAAGTSLSGQSLSDSLLLVAAHKWQKYAISEDASLIKMQPGIVGERVNQLLKPYGRKITPDPASFKSARIGGIVVNNASGMSCGVHANSDRMLVSARIIFADGTLLDTGDAASREAFARKHPYFIDQLLHLRSQVRDNPSLEKRIRHKYSIKNVTGLNLLPLALYDEPFALITHLMVGSEGTLGFLSEVTMRTAPLEPFHTCSMAYFKDLNTACLAVSALKTLNGKEEHSIVAAAELLDYKALKSVGDPSLAVFEKAASETAAILFGVEASSEAEMHTKCDAVVRTLQGFETVKPVEFTTDEKEYARLWQIRSGVFPAVGGSRPPGTTALIEDVAFQNEDMPEAIEALQQLLNTHGYSDACIYGHALDGNVHFILNQSFNTDEEILRYENLMNDVVQLVTVRYDGSLKAEHGTGRNMAPFVRREWGAEAFQLMKDIKRLFDPHGLLNPGVIFNDDPQCHIKSLKPLPLTNPVVDKCIECGFCEVNCLTCGFTFSSRQRIVVQREISRLQNSSDNATLLLRRLKRLKRQYRYAGDRTCAADGLCATSCPMEINTGDLTHALRSLHNPVGSTGYNTGVYAALHLPLIRKALTAVLFIADTCRLLLGARLMSLITECLHSALKIPLWTPSMPKPRFRPADHLIGNAKDSHIVGNVIDNKKVVYFPSCLNQTMGLPRPSAETEPLIEATVALFNKGGYEVLFPKNMQSLCCGMIWESKGMADIADTKLHELEKALTEASCGGKYPVVCDQSPCLYRLRKHCHSSLPLFEPAEFIYKKLLPNLSLTPVKETVAVHITCSMRKMGLADTVIKLASLCAEKVVIPDEVGCCGFAGDKGFIHPEVNAYALRHLRQSIVTNGAHAGYCNSRTCEIGLTTHSGIEYRSIVYLVNLCLTK